MLLDRISHSMHPFMAPRRRGENRACTTFPDGKHRVGDISWSAELDKRRRRSCVRIEYHMRCNPCGANDMKVAEATGYAPGSDITPKRRGKSVCVRHSLTESIMSTISTGVLSWTNAVSNDVLDRIPHAMQPFGAPSKSHGEPRVYDMPCRKDKCRQQLCFGFGYHMRCHPLGAPMRRC